MGPLAAIKAQIPALAHPDTAGTAAIAIDRAYRQLWADVHDVGTLFSLRQGLIARNMLYEGNTIANIYKLLKSGSTAVRDPKVSAALLAILSALLTDVPAAFAAEGYCTHIYEVMEDGELIVPDTNELNAMRAQPVFVTLALDTLLQRPETSDHDPHVCVGYLNDLISMDGVDYITSTAMQNLLDDQGFRETLFRGLQSHDPHKLFKCLQILKRCVGGGPGMFSGFQSIHHKIHPPWDLKSLLLLGAEQSLVTVCNTVAAMVREHTVERQLLGLLHTTLLDIFELLCVEDGSSSSSSGQQQQGLAAAAAAAPVGEGSSSSSSGSGWSEALVKAHVGLVIEVANLVPFLISSIPHMRHYCHSDAVCKALHQLGPGQAMSALVSVLDAGDPTDWLIIKQETEAYQVLNAICQQDTQLALAAVAAGAPRTIHTALLEWAEYLPLPSNQDHHADISNHLDDVIPGPGVSHRHDYVSPHHEDYSLHSNRSLQTNSSMQSETIFEVEVHSDQAVDGHKPPAAAAAAAAGVGASTVISTQPAAADGDDLAVGSSNAKSGKGVSSSSSKVGIFVDPQISAAVMAAMQLLLTLLRASSAYCSSSSNNNNSSSKQVNSTSHTLHQPPSRGPIPDAAASQSAAAAAAVPARASPVSLSVLCKHQGLPQLLVDLGQLEILEILAINCLVELDKLALLPAAVKDLLDAALAAAAAVADEAAEAGQPNTAHSAPAAAAVANGISGISQQLEGLCV